MGFFDSFQNGYNKEKNLSQQRLAGKSHGEIIERQNRELEYKEVFLREKSDAYLLEKYNQKSIFENPQTRFAIEKILKERGLLE